MISQIFKRKFSISNDAVALVKEIIVKKPTGSLKTIQETNSLFITEPKSTLRPFHLKKFLRVLILKTGWVSSVRKMGKIIFIDVNDGSCCNSIQIVCLSQILKEPVKWGTSINATGTVNVTEKGQVELQANELRVIGACDVTDNFPFTPKQKHSFDYYRQFLHFRLKEKYFASMLRFRSAASLKIHDYFNENDFTLIHTPIITSGDCEGAAETFLVKPESQKLINSVKKNNTDESAFFNLPAYLTVSGQLHLEAVVRSITKAYTFNPSFRAENSKSRLHLSEFYMIEAEEAFIEDLKDVLQRIEGLIKYVMTSLLANYSDEINYMLHYIETDSKQHLRTLENIIANPFTVMNFEEAKDITSKNKEKLRSPAFSLYNLSKEEELFLVQYNNNIPVFVIDWPKSEKPFYMKESTENPDLVKAVDLLVPNVGELCGGSLREDNYNILKQRLNEKKTLDSLNWYLELRKFGNVPSGGFGLGFERFLQFLLNIQNIKDAIPFPRWPHGLQL